MNVSYWLPLRRAVDRMVRMLFRPFRIELWLVVGFAAFLSELLSGGGGGGKYSWKMHDRGWPHGWGEGALTFLHHPFATVLGALIVICAVLLAILLLWVSSRGKFVFLDNVARETPAFFEPWSRTARLGDSLFVWCLVFGMLVVGLVVGLVAVVLAVVGVGSFYADGAFRLPAIAALIPIALSILPVVILIAYIAVFLSDFVVPIMYRQNLRVTAAWGRFLALFRRHPGAFILYGIMVLVIHLVVGSAVMALGFATCCVGFVLLKIPYVGTLILLPVGVTLRALGPEFLSQFGPDVTVFAAPAPAPAAPVPTPPPAPPPAQPPLAGPAA